MYSFSTVSSELVSALSHFSTHLYNFGCPTVHNYLLSQVLLTVKVIFKSPAHSSFMIFVICTALLKLQVLVWKEEEELTTGS